MGPRRVFGEGHAAEQVAGGVVAREAAALVAHGLDIVNRHGAARHRAKEGGVVVIRVERAVLQQRAQLVHAGLIADDHRVAQLAPLLEGDGAAVILVEVLQGEVHVCCVRGGFVLVFWWRRRRAYIIVFFLTLLC